MARHSIESTFRASVLGNWEVPRQAKRRSGGGSSYASSFGGSVASRRSSRSRASSRRSRRPGSRVSIIVDEHGHLLPQHKKNDSSFRYEITDSKDPVAKSAGMFVTWDEFDNVQDQLATNALALFGGASSRGGGRRSVMSAERPRSVGSAPRGPRTLPRLGATNAAGRPKTPDSIFQERAQTPVLEGLQDEDMPEAAARSQLLRLEHDSDDARSARDCAVWVGGVPTDMDEEQLKEVLGRFGEVTAVSIRKKPKGGAWAFVVFALPETATTVCDYMTISEAGVAMTIARPDFARMTHADKKVFGQVWRETLRKSKHGRILDSVRTQIEQSRTGNVRSFLKDFKAFRLKAKVRPKCSEASCTLGSRAHPGLNNALSGEQQHPGRTQASGRFGLPNSALARIQAGLGFAQSADNRITEAEFGKALRYCNLQLSKQEVKELFSAIDVDGSGYLDKEEFSLFVMGRYHALGARMSPVHEGGEGDGFGAFSVSGHGTARDAAKRQKDALREAARSHQVKRPPGAGPASTAPAVDRSVWVGSIPEEMRSEEQLREALKQFGEIEAVTLRRKEGDWSWAFVVFVSQADAHKAQAAGTVTKVTVREGKKQERELKIKPVALKRELHAERRHLDNPTGTLVRRDRLCATLAGGLHV